MILIADSGSTKVDWCALREDGTYSIIKTAGINPVFITKDKIINILKEKLLSVIGTEISAVYFYGAGVVSNGVCGDLAEAFGEVFPKARCESASDILAAARAVCGHNKGIACIMGTGSNSCFYDGSQITQHVNAGGFILGDEASGGVLGRKLVSDYIKGVLPKDLQAAFTEEYHLDYAQIVDKVYKQPVPSRFLASFSHFIEAHMDTPHIDHLLRSSFKEFFTRNVYQYDYKNYKVNFVGSIAFVFRKILEQVAEECGVEIGIIMRSPIEGLIHYHQIDVKGGR